MYLLVLFLKMFSTILKLQIRKLYSLILMWLMFGYNSGFPLQ